jgi:hypothetical protein
MLSQRILNRFGHIPLDATEPSQYYAVYNKILSGAFDIFNSNYIVEPMYAPEVEDPLSPHMDVPAIDFVVTHDFAMTNQPIFFVAIKPGNVHSEPDRLAADAQMRHIFRALRDNTPIPVLHGISVMNQKFTYYSMTKATNDIVPKDIETPQDHTTNTIPVDRWLDITTEEGYQQFMAIVDNVKRMVATAL